MAEGLILIDVLMRGVGAGALIVTAAAILRSRVSRDARLAVVLTAVTVSLWLIVEAPAMRAALGGLGWVEYPAFAVAGCFWLLVLTLFEDRPVTPATLAPAALLLATGPLCALTQHRFEDVFWAGRNLAAALLCAHAAWIIAKGWRGDLLEGRRRARALLLGATAVYAVLSVVFGFAYRLQADGPWLAMTSSGVVGGAIFAGLIAASAGLLLQARADVFGASRRSESGADARNAAIEREAVRRLEALMAQGAWRREGLTIGALARELSLPEHRLRRLINGRLGYRNFADFLNAQRVEAAKRRLADPSEARTTVAAIAFDLGYGSLGPFNRAFRAATGATPSEWRKSALEASPELKEAV